MSIKAFILGSALVSAFREPEPVTGPGEIVPGVDKPSMILARMCAAEMIEHSEIKYSPWRDAEHLTSIATATFPTLTVTCTKRVNRCDGSVYFLYSYAVKNSTLRFDELERKVLDEGRETWGKLSAEYAKLAAEEKRQADALTAIEKLFKKEPEPSPASPNATQAWEPSRASSASSGPTTSSAPPAVTSCLVPVEID